MRRALGFCLVLALLAGACAWGGRHLWAWYHFRAARSALVERAAPREALSHLDACLSVWPCSPSSHLLAAQAARRAGELPRAEDHLDTVWKLQGTTEEGTLEETLLKAQRDGLTRESEAYLLARVGADDATALPILDVLTADHMRTHRLVEARRYLDDWLRRRPQTVEALVRRGWVAEHLVLFPQARADYEAVLILDPARDPVRLRVAEILLQEKQATPALPHLERLFASRPDDAAVRLALARCRAELGQTAEARQLLEPIVADGAAPAAALGLRGRLALAEGDAEEAERWLRRAVARDPYDPEATYNLQLCLKRLDRGAEAAELAARLERIDADRKRMGVVVQEVLRRPRDVAPRCEAGRIFLRNGFTDDGVRWLGTALEIDPDCAEAHAALADHFEKAGDAERAATHRQRAKRP